MNNLKTTNHEKRINFLGNSSHSSSLSNNLFTSCVSMEKLLSLKYPIGTFVKVHTGEIKCILSDVIIKVDNKYLIDNIVVKNGKKYATVIAKR